MQPLRGTFGSGWRKPELHARRSGNAQHCCEQGMQAAQISLGGMIVVRTTIMLRILVQRPLPQLLMHMPHRVRERALLRGKQGKDANELQ
jgi:hypothetical protein